MKKRIQYIAAALLLCATFGTFGACKKDVVIPDPNPDPIPEPDPSPSVVYGLPEGGTGRYISNSDVLDDGDTRYLVCTTNETQAEEDNVIAVYKAKYEAGEGNRSRRRMGKDRADRIVRFRSVRHKFRRLLCAFDRKLR